LPARLSGPPIRPARTAAAAAPRSDQLTRTPCPTMDRCEIRQAGCGCKIRLDADHAINDPFTISADGWAHVSAEHPAGRCRFNWST
jgi:hypothetical protein